MKPISFRSVRFHQIGDASVLKIERVPLEPLAANEVRIRVRAIGLNRAEVMFRNGEYLETPKFPSKLGYEAAGTVESVGGNVNNFSVGDKVSTIPAFSIGEHGVYGEIATVPQCAVVKSPELFSYRQNAAIWMQYITAYGALIDIAQIRPKQYVAITAASSSVGVAAIHVAKHVGAVVIAITRGENKKQFLLEQGADHVICTDTEELVSKTMSITENIGVELVFDPISGPILNDLAEISATGGRILEYGALDNRESPYPLFAALAKGLIIQGYTLFEITKNNKRLENAKQYLLELFNSGTIEPVIDSVFSLDKIQDAHRYMESNQQKGKIVVEID